MGLGYTENFWDFKTKQKKKCMRQCSLKCESTYILKVYSIHYTLR